MGRWVTASQLKRAMACPASMVLKQSDKPYSKNATKAAEFGTNAHHYLETGEIRPGVEEWASRFSRDKIYPPDGWHEAIAWYRPDTGEMGLKPPGDGPRKHRDYDSLYEYALVGTLDYVNLKCADVPIVDDLKTTTWFPPPPNAPQLKFAGMVISHIFNTEVILSVTHIPRYPKGKGPMRAKYRLTKGEAAIFKIKLDALYEAFMLESRRQRLGQKLSTVKNSECKFCPSRFVCPEYNE